MDSIILKSFIPESFLLISILFLLIFNIRIINNTKYNFPLFGREAFYQTLFIIICLLFLFFNLKIEGFFSNFLFVNDESTRLIKIGILLICFFSLNIILQVFNSQNLNFFEFFILYLLSLLSFLLLVSASDLITFYLIIEMQSLCFYILASFKRNSSFSAEAGLKYFISGAFISGFFLFGATLLYGCLGTLNFNDLSLLLSFPLNTCGIVFNSAIFVGVIFITSTLLFKIACAPFHFWAPDVYEGSPLSSTIIFSIIPKLAIIFFFIKWISCLNIYSNSIESILLFCGVFSAFLGTFYALSQKRLKKLIIYSSVSQIGFLVAGLSLNSLDGYIFVLFFLFIYLATSILIWSHFSLFYFFQQKINLFFDRKITTLFISSLNNLFHLNKIWAFSFIIIFFSIGGIPPLTGFLAKILILFEILNANYLIASILLILISSVSVYYYIRMIKIMFFEPKITNKYSEHFQVTFYDLFLDEIFMFISILLMFLLFTFFYPTFLLLLCQYIVLNTVNF